MEVGYCQGMTNVAATILMYCEEEVKIKLQSSLVRYPSIFNSKREYIESFCGTSSYVFT
jgi:hypothetical protein